MMLFGFGWPGPMELLIIFGILLLLFGSARLPSLMRNIGRSAVEFKKGVSDAGKEFDEALKGDDKDID